MEDSLTKKLTKQKNFEETDGDVVLWTSVADSPIQIWREGEEKAGVRKKEEG